MAVDADRNHELGIKVVFGTGDSENVVPLKRATAFHRQTADFAKTIGTKKDGWEALPAPLPVVIDATCVDPRGTRIADALTIGALRFADKEMRFAIASVWDGVLWAAWSGAWGIEGHVKMVPSFRLLARPRVLPILTVDAVRGRKTHTCWSTSVERTRDQTNGPGAS